MAHDWSAMVDLNQSCAASDVVSSMLERDRSQASMEAKVHVPARHRSAPSGKVGMWGTSHPPRSCYPAYVRRTHHFHAKSKGSEGNFISKVGFLGLIISKICKKKEKIA